LQKQLNDLLFARAQPNSLFFHQNPPLLLSPPPALGERLNLTDSHSIHVATLSFNLSVTLKHPSPQPLADVAATLWEVGYPTQNRGGSAGSACFDRHRRAETRIGLASVGLRTRLLPESQVADPYR
jgi:hypothetical protein